MAASPVRWPVVTLLAVMLLAATAVLPAAASSGVTERVSVTSGSAEVNGDSYTPSISADGRYVAFHSRATNLVAGDTNDADDVFVHDRETGTTERVSVDSNGHQGNGFSRRASISGDGRYVAFESSATNLVEGDDHGFVDVFVHDRHDGTTERVSVDSDGIRGDAWSFLPSISGDGRYVTFYSGASNLVAGDTNDADDVFVRDRETGTTERVSVDSDGIQGNGDSYSPSISGDGRYVAFESSASNLVAGDDNNYRGVFVRDRQTGTTERVSVDSEGNTGANGSSAQPSISADGRYVTFYSTASNLVAGVTNRTWDVFVRDRTAGTTERVSVSSAGDEGNSYSMFQSSISADGRYVAFYSMASNLVAGDTNGTWDVFVRDRHNGTTQRVSVDSGGTQGDGLSVHPSISADGHYVAFHSGATNLVEGDTNGFADVFVHGVADLPPPNQPPTVDAGGDVAGGEGAAITLLGSVNDPDQDDTITTLWSVDVDAPCSFADPSAAATTITCTDDGEFIATLTVDDGQSTATDTTRVTVYNVAPTITGIVAPTDPAAADATVNVSATFTDPGADDTHTCTIDWGDDTTSDATISGGVCSGSRSYPAPGVYTLAVTVTDDDGGAGTADYEYVVVYDPDGGFVTGGGWIDSPEGAYLPDASMTGRATFGFVSRYSRGAVLPTGNTNFQFQAGDLDFQSTSYDWLVVTGNDHARFKGYGTINDAGANRFQVWAGDGDVDTFRIKIWEEKADGSEIVVYDNGMDQSISRGNIMVHTSRR